ncbi:polymer-forming cytoskeletal protein [Paenibacillus sp. 1011MAR3C5]|uniref:bactofilin family protein n=1 Tax=Paenibacillus sp. 1011MAR3C5 TaxID=1675787 RepID=UPI000E6D5238|nr:polymer-forming cytoskeletal protein [Paenibacillus sp. 1011MAR3C5]RJE88867.1 polymer-forming cytoskeletal protein [Paenibacillus sp. 1011MAR3C5]
MFKETKRVIATDTLIGQGTIAEGKIVSEANLRIEGEFRGDIECKGDVIIGECGVARSNILAQDVTLAGKLFGDIETTGRLIIAASGQLVGNVKAHSLIIQDGGMLNGSCHMEQAVDNKQKPLSELESQANAKQDKNDKSKSRQAG